ADHKLRNGQLFKYHDAQREAIETLIYVYEVARVRTRKDLLEHYVSSHNELRLPSYDEFARYCTKMATGSGKTKVMALAIVWQFFNAVRENEADYAKTFLMLPM
ncbi:MAG: DEAD/DEAH box helicase family protein, partial [Ktedonobacteraceae bacterium]|nr:DEAD/DEAH box helicase family protein [Ktedonobacteraceae bacterium]